MIEHSGSAGISLESGSVAMFVQTASKFTSAINIHKSNKTANAKSIMGLISLGVVEGQDIVLTAEGEDEEKAVAELSGFLKIR